MTTKDLHQHFKVVYDKANVITSYPSFLPEETDIWLNKANNMMINQKFTGNNTRRIAFEGDIKRIADLQKLISNASIDTHTNVSYINNAISFELSTIPDLLFIVSSLIKLDGNTTSEVLITGHEVAKRVMETDINKPWIPRPIATLADDCITVYYDSITHIDVSKATISITYIRKPMLINFISSPDAVYELEDNVAYELIDLAVAIALENIESQRLNTKLQTLTLNE